MKTRTLQASSTPPAATATVYVGAGSSLSLSRPPLEAKEPQIPPLWVQKMATSTSTSPASAMLGRGASWPPKRARAPAHGRGHESGTSAELVPQPAAQPIAGSAQSGLAPKECIMHWLSLRLVGVVPSPQRQPVRSRRFPRSRMYNQRHAEDARGVICLVLARYDAACFATTGGYALTLLRRRGLGASFALCCVWPSTLCAAGTKDALSVGSVCLVQSRKGAWGRCSWPPGV